MRLIDAEKLRHDWADCFDSYFGDMGCDTFKTAIDRTPTIDPEEILIVKELREKLARYKQAENDGRLIELPCEVGDTVYVIKRGMFPYDPYYNVRLIEGAVDEFSVDRYMETAMVFRVGPIREAVSIKSFGKLWFLSKAEAEAKLKEIEKYG